jgi:hypothetical protein
MVKEPLDLVIADKVIIGDKVLRELWLDTSISFKLRFFGGIYMSIDAQLREIYEQR